MQNNNRTGKIIIWAIVIVLIIVGIWWYMHKKQNVGTNYMPENTTATQTNQSSTNGSTSASNTSDAAISSDLGNIDNQMTGLNEDSQTTAPVSDNQ